MANGSPQSVLVVLDDDDEFLFNTAKSFINILVRMFRTTWDGIPFSFEVDRTPIFDLGNDFSVLEYGLIKAGLVDHRRETLPGIYCEDIICRCDGVGQASLTIVEPPETALVQTYGIQHWNGGTPVLFEMTLSETMDLLLDMNEHVIQFREEIETKAEEMDNFVELNGARMEALGVYTRRVVVRLGAMVGCLYQSISEVTHLRVRMHLSSTPANSTAVIDFTPAWGETADFWASQDWHPTNWVPLRHQTEIVGCPVSNDLSVYHWNVRGIENEAMERSLKRINELCSPKMMIITSAFASSNSVRRVLGILGWSGYKVKGSHGGTWVVWDERKVAVQFVIESEDIYEFVMVKQAL